MELNNLQYSLKNIPVADRFSYMKVMMRQFESWLRRARWRIQAHLKKFGKRKETYGFKSSATPPAHPEFTAFEDAAYAMMRNIEFKQRRKPFLQKLARDVKEINSSPCVFVEADKTGNLYKMEVEDYKKIVKDNVTKVYEKSGDGVQRNINCEAKQIARKLDLDDRMEIYAEREAFITLKDHKQDFQQRPQCRLINPAHPEMGVVSKQLLERCNKKVREETSANQWRSTKDVIKWFNGLTNKARRKFVKFDVKEFYPSIDAKLLRKAIDYARSVCPQCLSDEDVEIIWHARQSLLFSGNSAWNKKGGKLFDVTMGAFDGAEVCELVGLYILSLIAEKFGANDFGLYRDDGLGAIVVSGPEGERAKKELHKIAKKCDLGFTVDGFFTLVDFLDANFDLPSGRYWPYTKPNAHTKYVHAHSNHPPIVLKHLPDSITERISSLSCNVDEFNKAKGPYERALRESSYKYRMEYKETPADSDATPNGKRQRKRNVLWFNPPYNDNVVTNVARRFLELMDTFIHRDHPFRCLFNRSTVKVSYCTMRNMGAIIKSHNAKVLAPPPTAVPLTMCSCPRAKKSECPLDGQCLTKNMVYKATVSCPGKPDMHYYGLATTTFKERYNGHNSDFRLAHARKKTALAKHIWQLKDSNQNFSVKWSIFRKCAPYMCGSRKCDLCLTEKAAIILADPRTLINEKSEILSGCRHRAKYKYATSPACE